MCDCCCTGFLAKWRMDRGHKQERERFEQNEKQLRSLHIIERDEDIVELEKLQKAFKETMRHSKLVFGGYEENISSKSTTTKRSVVGRLTRNDLGKWSLFVGFQSAFTSRRRASHPSPSSIGGDDDNDDDDDAEGGFAMKPLLASQHTPSSAAGDGDDFDFALSSAFESRYDVKLSSYASRVSDVVTAVLSQSGRFLFVECGKQQLILLFHLAQQQQRVPMIVNDATMDLFGGCLEPESIFYALFFTHFCERDPAANEVIELVLEAMQSMSDCEVEFSRACDKVRTYVRPRQASVDPSPSSLDEDDDDGENDDCKEIAAMINPLQRLHEIDHKAATASSSTSLLHSEAKTALPTAASAAQSAAGNLSQRFTQLNPELQGLVADRRVAGQRLVYSVSRAKMLMRLLLGERVSSSSSSSAAATTGASDLTKQELEFLNLKDFSSCSPPEILARAASVLWSLHHESLLDPKQWKQFLVQFEPDSIPVPLQVLFHWVSRSACAARDQPASSFMPPMPRLPAALEQYRRSVVEEEQRKMREVDSDDGLAAFFTDISAVWSWMSLATISTDGLVAFSKETAVRLRRAAAALVKMESKIFGRGARASSSSSYSEEVLLVLRRENTSAELFPPEFESRILHLVQRWKELLAQEASQKERIAEKSASVALSRGYSPIQAKQMERECSTLQEQLAEIEKRKELLRAEEIQPLLTLRPEMALLTELC